MSFFRFSHPAENIEEFSNTIAYPIVGYNNAYATKLEIKSSRKYQEILQSPCPEILYLVAWYISKIILSHSLYLHHGEPPISMFLHHSMDGAPSAQISE